MRYREFQVAPLMIGLVSFLSPPIEAIQSEKPAQALKIEDLGMAD